MTPPELQRADAGRRRAHRFWPRSVVLVGGLTVAVAAVGCGGAERHRDATDNRHEDHGTVELAASAAPASARPAAECPHAPGRRPSRAARPQRRAVSTHALCTDLPSEPADPELAEASR